MKFLLTGVLVFSYVCLSAQEQEAVVLTNNTTPALLGKDVYYFEDHSGKLSIGDILSPAYQQRFRRHHRHVYSRPASRMVIWFKIVVTNKTGEEVWLETGGSLACGYIDFYRPDKTGTYGLPVRTGSLRPPESKEYPVHNYWLRLAGGADTTAHVFYARMESDFPHEYPLKAGTIRAFIKCKEDYDYLFAGFAGLMLIMVCYNLFLALAARDRIYLTYVGYLIGGSLIVFFDMGHSPSEDAWWWKHFLVWHNIGPLSAGLFAIQYLSLRQNAPRLNIAVWSLLGGICIGFPVLHFLGIRTVDLINPYQASIALLYSSLLGSGVYLWTRGYRHAAYFVAGWTFLIVSIVVFLLVSNGVVPLNMFTQNSLYFGVGLEVLMFSLALANRLNIMRAEKEEAQQANLRLIQEQNQTLEQRIRERTIEIQQQKEEIETQASQLLRMNEQLVAFNANLATLVKQRAHTIVEQERKLAEYAFINSHKLRAPVATLLGLISLIESRYLDEEELRWALSNLGSNVVRIDEIVSEITRAIEESAAETPRNE